METKQLILRNWKESEIGGCYWKKLIRKTFLFYENVSK